MYHRFTSVRVSVFFCFQLTVCRTVLVTLPVRVSNTWTAATRVNVPYWASCVRPTRVPRLHLQLVCIYTRIQSQQVILHSVVKCNVMFLDCKRHDIVNLNAMQYLRTSVVKINNNIIHMMVEHSNQRYHKLTKLFC